MLCRRVRPRSIAALLTIAALVTSCTGNPKARPSHSPVTLPAATSAPEQPVHRLVSGPAHPNIVFVLTDDLSEDLVQYMPHVLAMERAGMTFTNYTVTDSLCCPSRSSILTGEFPHDTGVFTNSATDGGYSEFQRKGDENRTFAVALHTLGYRTEISGKYLNGYEPNTDGAAPGWSDWDVAGNGYPEYDYKLNESGRIVQYGHTPRDYLVDVQSRLGSQFIAQSAATRTPFLLEIATFDPHAPYTPAPQDTHSFPGLRAPRRASWNRLPTNAPKWLAPRKPLTKALIKNIDESFRLRVQAVQSVDRMIGALEDEVRSVGQAGNTIFVFNSDNGLHMGDYRLAPGKLTAFDTDIKVPLVVTGPHIPAGKVSAAVTQNIDLTPTFESLAGITPPSTVDGRSLVPLLYGEHVPWRTMALVEHHGRDYPRNDPDYQHPVDGDPTSYEAVRTATWTYVQYRDGEHEFYDRATDPAELDNIYAQLPADFQRTLTADAAALANCHGSASCWAAGQPSG